MYLIGCRDFVIFRILNGFFFGMRYIRPNSVKIFYRTRMTNRDMCINNRRPLSRESVSVVHRLARLQ